MKSRRPALVAVVLLLSASGCRAVTAPELLRLSEQMLQPNSEPGTEYLLRDLFQVGPWSSAIGEIDVMVAGRAYKLKAIVVEGVTVPANPADGYPCPRINRSLVALGEKQSLVMTGLDFSIPFSTEIMPCQLGRLPNREHRQLNPALWTGGIPDSLGGVAFEGTGSIQPLLEPRDRCPFIPPPGILREEPPGVTCELSSFEVEISATLHRSAWPHGPEMPIVLRRQRLPGIRLTHYCRFNSEFIGCSDDPRS